MISSSLLTEFRNLLGKENVLDSEADRHAYSYDAAVLDAVVPELVLRPSSSEQLGKTVALCNENKLPMTVRGAGTNLSGGTIPTKEQQGLLPCLTRYSREWACQENQLFQS